MGQILLLLMKSIKGVPQICLMESFLKFGEGEYIRKMLSEFTGFSSMSWNVKKFITQLGKTRRLLIQMVLS